MLGLPVRQTGADSSTQATVFPYAAALVWKQHSAPAANTQATVSQAAGAAGVYNVCTGLTVTFCAGATAPTAVQISVALIDGGSGGTNYLWGPHAISLPATAGAMNGIALANLWIPGSAATAMTLEFSAAGGANTVESVSMTGVTVQG
jgi:hypothetical protein